MPVSYKVWISGFADDEREVLASVFAHRSLIAYRPSPSPDDAQLVLADADRPQLAGAAGPRPEAGTTLWVGHAMPVGARWHVPRPIDPTLVLRMLDELVARERPAPERVVDAFQALWMRMRTRPAGLDGPVDGLRTAAPPPMPRAAGAPAVGDRRRHKASQRAAIRRALQIRAARSAGGVAPLAGAMQALVLDAHGPSRVEAGVLLEAVGFRVATVGSVLEAERALWTRPFAVAFLAGGPSGDADATIALCHRIKHGAYGAEGLPTPKVVVRAGHPRAADPVRARLAGCDHFVAGEATRGALAMALEAVEVPMPRDPRGARG